MAQPGAGPSRQCYRDIVPYEDHESRPIPINVTRLSAFDSFPTSLLATQMDTILNGRTVGTPGGLVHEDRQQISRRKADVMRSIAARYRRSYRVRDRSGRASQRRGGRCRCRSPVVKRNGEIPRRTSGK
jgi:hypothetical protein